MREQTRAGINPSFAIKVVSRVAMSWRHDSVPRKRRNCATTTAFGALRGSRPLLLHHHHRSERMVRAIPCRNLNAGQSCRLDNGTFVYHIRECQMPTYCITRVAGMPEDTPDERGSTARAAPWDNCRPSRGRHLHASVQCHDRHRDQHVLAAAHLARRRTRRACSCAPASTRTTRRACAPRRCSCAPAARRGRRLHADRGKLLRRQPRRHHQPRGLRVHARRNPRPGARPRCRSTACCSGCTAPWLRTATTTWKAT